MRQFDHSGEDTLYRKKDCIEKHCQDWKIFGPFGPFGPFGLFSPFGKCRPFDFCKPVHCCCPVDIADTPELSGLELQLQSPSPLTVESGAPVVFDTVIASLSSFISYNGLGTITITQSGVYYIGWWIAINGIAGGTDFVPTFAVITSAGDYIKASSPLIVGQLSGNALISIAASPAHPVTLQLINVTDGTVMFGLNSVQADLTIITV